MKMCLVPVCVIYRNPNRQGEYINIIKLNLPCYSVLVRGKFSLNCFLQYLIKTYAVFILVEIVL